MNMNDVGLRVNDGGSYFEKRRYEGFFNPERPYLLSVESPIDSTYDIGSSSFNTRSVRHAFSHAYFSLLSAGKARSLKQGGCAPSNGGSGEGAPSNGDLCERALDQGSRLCLLGTIIEDIEVDMAKRFEMHSHEGPRDDLGDSSIDESSPVGVFEESEKGGKKRSRGKGKSKHKDRKKVKV